MADNILFTSEQIAKRIEELAKEISADYNGKKIIVVGILKGAFILSADLARALHRQGLPNEISFLTLKSYFSSTTTAKDIHLAEVMDLDPKGKDILVVDDIFDTGKSFQFVDKYVRERGAISVKGFALLAKPERHTVVYRPTYVGFSIPNVWVEGYGMDSAERGRSNPNIVVGTSDE